MIGRKLLHYDIIQSLGEGGMGVVYKAVDTRLQRPVALKFISPSRIGDEENRTRLVNEARSAASLRHPNICTIYDIEETPDGQAFISMATWGPFARSHPVEGRHRSRRAFTAAQVAEGFARRTRGASSIATSTPTFSSPTAAKPSSGFRLAKLPASGSVHRPTASRAR
jgi:serine/threonine protein kinase